MRKSPLHNQNTHTSLIWVVILICLLTQLPRAFSQTAEIQIAGLDAADDIIKPIARCINGTGLELNAKDQTAVIWAADVNQFSVDNNSVTDFRLSLSADRTTKAPDFDYISFTKDQTGMQKVDLWVSDIAGNWDMCTTYVYVYNPKNAEPTSPQPNAISVTVVGANTAPAASKLYQNSPNPFKTETAINFYQAENDPVQLRLFNAAGHTIKTFKGPFDTGFNEIILSNDDLEPEQILFYQLNSSSGIQTRKMIRME